MKTFRLSSGASEDLDDIADYIGGNNPAASDRVILSIRKTMAMLAENPLMGRLHGRVRHHLRVFPALKSAKNYLIFYEAEPEGILVLAVLHGARDWQRIFRTGER